MHWHIFLFTQVTAPHFCTGPAFIYATCGGLIVHDKLSNVIYLQNKYKGKQTRSNLLGWALVRLYRLEMFWHTIWLLLEIAIRCVTVLAWQSKFLLIYAGLRLTMSTVVGLHTSNPTQDMQRHCRLQEPTTCVLMSMPKS